MAGQHLFHVRTCYQLGKFEATLNDDGSIRYEASHSENQIITPSENDWVRFVRSCKRIGIDKWDAQYDSRDIIEAYWTIEIDIDGLKYKGKGANVLPAGFQSFTSAVSRLLGGLEFA
jgi:hypothetical protein